MPLLSSVTKPQRAVCVMGLYRLNRKLVAPTLPSLQQIPVTISDSIIRTELLSARRIIAKLDTQRSSQAPIPGGSLPAINRCFTAPPVDLQICHLLTKCKLYSRSGRKDSMGQKRISLYSVFKA